MTSNTIIQVINKTIDPHFFKITKNSDAIENHYVPRKTKDEITAAPCDACENKCKCRTYLLACQQYAVWLDSRVPKKEHGKTPTKKIYNRLFGIPKK